MIIKEINLIIEHIPDLLQYFIPGYWSMIIFKYFCAKKFSKHIMTIMSCVISYMLLTMISIMRAKFEFLSVIPDKAIANSGISMFLGTILAILFSLSFSSKWFSKLTVRFFHKTLNDDIWRDVLDFQNGSNLKIYIKEKDYYVIGHHKNHEEKDNDSWLALSSFAKYDKETNENYKEEPSFLDDENAIFTIRFSDIEHIEIFN